LDLSKLKNPRGVSSSMDGARLIIMTVLTIVVVVLFFFFRYQAGQQQDESSIQPDSFVEIPETRRVPGATVDPMLLADVRDEKLSDRVVKETAPYLHLIQQAARLVYGDMELLDVERLVPETVRNHPAAYRGKPFEVKGRLESFEKIAEHEFELYRGFLTTRNGDAVYFTVLDIPWDAAIGDVVKLQGFFFKLYSFNLPEEERVTDAIYLVGKQLIPSFYDMEPVHELNMKLLNTLWDYDILDMAKPFEEKHLYHMLSYVENLDPETVKSLDYQELLPPEILRKPGEFRGKPVQILGEVVLLPVQRDLGPRGENPLGIKRVYHGVLLNYAGGKYGFCYFISLKRPDWMRKKDLVYVRGFFMRNYAYRTQNENLQPSILVVAADFEKFVLPEDYTMAYISIAILAGTLVVFSIFFISIFRDRKHNRLYREKFIQRKKAQLKSMLEKEREKEST
jgi:hypothetical protein